MQFRIHLLSLYFKCLNSGLIKREYVESMKILEILLFQIFIYSNPFKLYQA